ncbi:hypothetical protein VO54_00005 [Elizabethkingia miricola]|nr:hypothetical protein VO54_00005 [Elizabethkingia miricola]
MIQFLSYHDANIQIYIKSKRKYCFYVQINNEYAIEIGEKPRFIACWRRFKKNVNISNFFLIT